MNYAYLDTPIGTLLIAGDTAAVHRITFPQRGERREAGTGWQESQRGPVGEAVRQLREYFAGKRAAFDLPLAPEGTAFQRTCVAAIAGDSLRRNDFLRRAGTARGKSQGIARRGLGERREPATDRDSVSSRDRGRRDVLEVSEAACPPSRRCLPSNRDISCNRAVAGR